MFIERGGRVPEGRFVTDSYIDGKLTRRVLRADGPALFARQPSLQTAPLHAAARQGRSFPRRPVHPNRAHVPSKGSRSGEQRAEQSERGGWGQRDACSLARAAPLFFSCGSFLTINRA